MTKAKNLGRILGLIPAKGSSSRLRRKNIRKLAGKSLLERAIQSAYESQIIDLLTVSTEDEKIAEEARLLGVDIPFMRPSYLSHDPCGVVDVALHALDEWEKRGESFQTLVILLPTSPFRTALDIRGAVNCYLEKGACFLHSVCKEEHSPLSSLILNADFLEPLFPEWINKTGAKSNNNTLKIVRANGAITIVNVEEFRKEKTYYAYPLAAYEMPWERSVDIDTERDLLWAEFVAKNVL